MKHYRRKPITVQAEQAETEMVVQSKEGQLTAKPGDWIITGTDGSKWVCASDAFDELYVEEDAPNAGFDFGQAIEYLKGGLKVARSGWNGRGMYLWLLNGAEVPVDWIKEQHLKEIAEANHGKVECLPSIRMRTADGRVLTGWLASQTDMMATDWYVVE